MGSLYLLFAIEAGVDGTLFSMRVRIELALPFVSRVYNVIITAHAFLMIFFLIMPALMGGFSNLLVPIQIGSAEMALPRLNAISFMLLPPSLLLLLSSVLVEVGAGVDGAQVTSFPCCLLWLIRLGGVSYPAPVPAYAICAAGCTMRLTCTLFTFHCPGQL